MRPTTTPDQTSAMAIVARIFLSLAWRSFAATRCDTLPGDVAAGVIAILTRQNEEQTI